MTSAIPERIKDDAASLFQSSELPTSFAFYERLTPQHQRLFAVELWEALSRVNISGDSRSLDDLVELVESWEATADLDGAPEVLEVIRRPKTYRPLAR